MKEFAKKGWYRLHLPESWVVDESESPVAFHPPDGEGTLQVTAETLPHRKPGERIDVFLAMRAFLMQTGRELDEAASKRYSRNGLEWAATVYVEEGLTWRIWFATNHDVLTFLTYSDSSESQDPDPVDRIVDSLELM